MSVLESFFVADKGFTEELQADWRAAMKPLHAIRKEITDVYGVDGLFMNGTTALGLCSVVHGDGDPEVPRGMRKSLHMRNGKRWVVFKPHRSFKEGLVLDRELRRYNSLAAGVERFSGYVVKRLDIGAFVIGACSGSRTGLAGYETAAGIAKGQLVVRIPYGGDSDEKLPKIPPQLREIKKSEFIALTEE